MPDWKRQIRSWSLRFHRRFRRIPYKTYVVGALKPDDFGSFEVTFSTNSTSSIPIQLSYKDTDGNLYTSVQDVKISEVVANDLRE